MKVGDLEDSGVLACDNKASRRLINTLKSLRRNPKGIAKVIRNPKKYFYYLLQGPMGMHLINLNSIGITAKSVMQYIDEFREDKIFYQDFFIKIKLAKKSNLNVSGWFSIDLLEILYAIIRNYQPKIVVETGVGPGSSSAFILKALHTNGCGVLYSIDFPGFNEENYYSTIGKSVNYVPIPNGWEVGWLIPPKLKYRWKLILGDAKLELPKLLEELGTIDIFLHDSLHSYEHMMFEYNQAWNHLRCGGILMSDDVNEYFSLAFIDFCKQRSIKYTILGGGD